MSKRYLGDETIIGRSQVIKYLTEIYTHLDGRPITEAQAVAVINKPENVEEIDKGISPFQSNVSYIGDKIGEREGWVDTTTEADYEEDDDDDD